MSQKIFGTLKKLFTWKRVLNFLLILWIIFSVGYITYDIWEKFRIRIFQAGYQQAIQDSVKAMIKQAEQCRPITLFDKNKKVKLFTSDCLSKKQPKQK